MMRSSNRLAKRSRRRPRIGSVAPGVTVIILLAIVSSVLIILWPVPKRQDLQMWTFARTHYLMYDPALKRRNLTESLKVDLLLIGSDAMGRRMMSGFLSNTPVADLIEVEKDHVGQAFTGPLEDVGFTDLTDLLHQSGIYDEMNEPSFSPWTSRGRIFGVPHDVAPVMLAYRADLVEAAGIDVSTIETWDDFARVMKPLMQERDADGHPKRYLLNLWQTSQDQIEVLILQAGGRFFDENDRITVDSDVNARVISTIVSWVAGPNRIAADAPEFSASGNQLRIEGYVVASIAPDWLCGVWKNDIPQLSGKVKLMPMPAWDRGGRRTSAWGGAMLGIPKASKKFDEAWKFAQYLYLSQDMSRRFYQKTNIISPVKKFWKDPCYDVPDPYFRSQSPGRLYIALAPGVPRRTSSPFNPLASARVQEAVLALLDYANANNVYDPAALHAEARRQLHLAQVDVQGRIDRNVFLKKGNE